MVTFRDLFVGATDYDDTDFFSAYFNRSTPHDPGVNALWLDFSPNGEEWEILLSYFEDYAFDLAAAGTILHHYSFRWPDNTGIHPDTLTDLSTDGFQLGQYALLSATQLADPSRAVAGVTIQPVTPHTWGMYNTLQQQGNASYGRRYQEAKAPYYTFSRDWPSVTQYLIARDQQPVGAFELIHTPESTELDQLIIAPEQQNRGIGSTVVHTLLQQAISEQRALVMKVDAEDEGAMQFYQRLHFQTVATQIMAMAPFSDDFVAELKTMAQK